MVCLLVYSFDKYNNVKITGFAVVFYPHVIFPSCIFFINLLNSGDYKNYISGMLTGLLIDKYNHVKIAGVAVVFCPHVIFH